MKWISNKLHIGLFQYGWLLCLCFSTQLALSQNHIIHGTVIDEYNKPVIAADVSILNPSVTTSTDAQGRFAFDEIGTTDTAFAIQVIAEGYSPIEDTLFLSNIPWTITINTIEKLTDVVISKDKKSTEIKLFTPIKTEDIGLKELAKAACCNLSESFETTPSVDAGFTDAVSGYKQISMLGLSGPNVAFTRENIPDIRGLASITGLTFTPGPWVQSIQLSKGAGSVVNGFEGVAGQINVELMKPGHNDERYKLLLNAYQSNQGRTEGNIVWNKEISENLNTTVLLHAKSNWLDVDMNKDGFLDQPKGETYLVGNRWMYLHPKGYEFQLGVKGTYMDLYGGQNAYRKNQEVSINNPWGFFNTTTRADIWSKIGKIYLDKPNKSMGLQLSAAFHDQSALYGLRAYDANQKSFYANYIFQNIIGTTDHLIKAGASFQYDKYDEQFGGQAYERTEMVPGVFTEYTYNYLSQFTVVAGIRADYNNLYGAFITPRLHMRFAPEENTSIRASIGRAQRTVNVLSEHLGYMSSNRTFVIPLADGDAYGLQPEVAYNMGINATKKFMLNYRDGSVSVDYYYTHFQNMVVADIESVHNLRFYNLEGKAYAHSFQAQLDYEIIRKWNTRIAYRYYDVKNTYDNGELLAKPLLANHRFFINSGYETKNNWAIDITANWTGTKRMVAHIPDAGAPVNAGYQTPSFWIVNGQLSKSAKNENWRVYLGVENIFNVMQHHLILSAQQPYAPGFDAGLVWGSGMGRNIYAGLNFYIR